MALIIADLLYFQSINLENIPEIVVADLLYSQIAHILEIFMILVIADLLYFQSTNFGNIFCMSLHAQMLIKERWV